MWRDEARLTDIVLSCREVMEYIQGVSKQDYYRDGKLQRALCMLLEIIGEAARSVSDVCKEANPQIPWRDLVGLRNRIVHEYFRLDREIIWEIVQRDVPVLLAQIEQIVTSRDETVL